MQLLVGVIFLGVFLTSSLVRAASREQGLDYNEGTDATPAPTTTLGMECTSNHDCTLERSYCKVDSPSCGIGSCQCIPGHAFDIQSQSCKRAIRGVGSPCNPNTDVCTGKNVFCYKDTKTCSCPSSYQEGKEGDCVPIVMTKSYGDSCSDDMECYYSLHCFDGQCGCATGQKKHKFTQCVRRSANDVCASQQDCSNAPNTACKDGFCQCLPGYKNISYWTATDEKSSVGNKNVFYKYRVGVTNTACIREGESAQPEGASCMSPDVADENGSSSSSNSNVQYTYCAHPFVCLPCGRAKSSSQQRYICSRTPMPYMDGSNSIKATLIMITFALFFAMHF